MPHVSSLGAKNLLIEYVSDCETFDFRSDKGEAKWLTVINVYCPRADPEREERAEFKQRFYQLLQIRAEAILESNR